MPEKVTTDQFADAVKKKYPQYASVPNDRLAAAVLQKYPQYREQVQAYPQSGQSGAPALAGQEPVYTPMDEKREVPPNARYPQLGPGFYSVFDFGAKALPTAGQIAGAAGGGAVGGPLGAVGGAGAGAAVGDRLERLAYNWLYKDLPPETAADAFKSMGTQAGLAAFTEAPFQLFKSATGPFLRDVQLARQAQTDAKAGTGVRLTPGEAGNDPLLKTSESVLQHWPGGAGEMEKFREQQVADVHRMMQDVLDDIHAKNLSPEQAGNLIREKVLEMKAKLDPQLASELDKTQSQLLNIVNTRVGRTLGNLGPDEISAENVGQGIQQKIREDQAQAEATTKQRIDDLHTRQEQSKEQLFQTHFNALSPAEVPREDVGKQIQQNFQTQKTRSDDILQGNVDKVRTEQKANVQTVLDRQLTMLSPQQLTSEQAGGLVQNEVNRLQRESEAAVTAKYDAAKKLAKLEGKFLSPEEFDKAVENNPEAKAALVEARLLAKQEFERFDPPILKKILNAPKEDIPQIMADARLEDLRILKDVLPPQVQKAAARELLESYIYRATDPRTGVVSAQSLANSFKQLGEDHGRLIFGTQYDTILHDVNKSIDGINAAADARVDRYSAQANAPFQPKLIQDILKPGKPEGIPKLIETASPDDLRAMNAALPPEMQKAASRAVLEDIIYRARDPQTGIIDGKKLAKSLFDMGEDRGRLIFGPRYDSIVRSSQDFARINERTEEVARYLQNENAMYDRDLFKKILKTGKPEEIVAKVQTAGQEELRQLMSALPVEQQQALRRSVYQSMVEKARDPQTGLVDARKLATSVSNLQQRGRIIFGDQYESIRETGRFLDRVTEASKEKLSRLNTSSARFSQKLYNDIITTNNPELIGGYFRGASPDDLRDFMRSVDPEAAQIAQRNVLEDILAPARDVQTQELDPQALTKNLRDGLKALGPTRGEITFGKEGWERLTDASKLLDRIAFTDNSPQAKMHMAGLISAAIGLVTGGTIGAFHSKNVAGTLEGAAFGALTLGAGSYLLPKVLAYTLTSPRFAVPMMRMLRLSAAAAARGTPLALNELLQTSPGEDALLPHMIVPQPREAPRQ